MAEHHRLALPRSRLGHRGRQSAAWIIGRNGQRGKVRQRSGALGGDVHGVGVYNVNGTFYAIANYCPHEGGPLCSGRVRGRTIVDEGVPGDAVMVRDLEFI